MVEHIVKHFWPDTFHKATRQEEGFTVAQRRED
jgi:hypothetical protein